MVDERLKGIGAFLAVIVAVSLVLSVIISIGSFTGYIVSEEVDIGANTWAAVLFFIGVVGAYFLFRKK